MKRILCWSVLVLVCLLATSVVPVAQSRTEFFDGHEVAPGEALVKFRAATREAIDRVLSDLDIDLNEDMAPIGWSRVHSRSLDATTLVRRLSARPEVDAAEPNYIVRALENVNLTPNDPSYGQLWGLENTGQVVQGVAGVPDADIDANLAWDTTTGSNSIVVGVVDTGIFYTHPDLVGNIYTSLLPFTVNMGGGPVTCPPGSHGVNTITNTCNPLDDNDHGSHVSGTIGATGNNANGVVGVNWLTSIAGFKFLNAGGSGSTADAIEAINAAVDMKRQGVAEIRVLNNSWGGGAFSTPLLNSIKRAAENDVMFVAAAGNSNSNNDVFPSYPASYPVDNVVAVAATDNRDLRAGFSNYGPRTVHLGAPGVAILSTIRNGNYAYFNGTSMASPHVAGAAALVLSACNLTTGQLKANLLATVDKIPSMRDRVRTNGRLNVDKAVDACAPPA